MNTPIAFIIFNRPELTARVFAAIRAAKPRQLLLIGDGPRNDVATDAERIAETRRVAQSVDWDCDVKTLFSDVNLGCKLRVTSGLDWAFGQSEELIILEDDCLPDPDFFSYCEQLLGRFRDDRRVMMISGDNFQPCRRTDSSYYFSRWSHIWGWASWRRAWECNDVAMPSWPRIRADGSLRSAFGSESEYHYWESVLDRQHAGEIDTWDFSWAYTCWINHGLTVLPEQNLISNLGFGPSATHTTDPESWLAARPTGPLGPLRHPDEVLPHAIADQYTWETIFQPPPAKVRRPWYQRVLSRSASL